jgi:probable rRNA maturation factor
LSRTLIIRNRQRRVIVNSPYLRRLILALLRDLLRSESFDLGVYLVRAPEMTRLNETFLRHKGSTDVITFDYGCGVPPLGGPGCRVKAELQNLHGEIFICVDEAISQARRFGTTWQSEVIRYVVHGLLHLNGYDDKHAASRRKMKREEDRFLGVVTRHFPLSKLGGRPRMTACKKAY